MALEMRCIDALIHEIAAPASLASDLDDASRITIWMLQSLGVSIGSIRKLTVERDMGIRDCFGIARSVAELGVNAAFIALSGEQAANRAVRHMQQKRWRDLSRTADIGGQTVTVSRTISEHLSDFPGLKESLQEFTTKKGGEVRDWTPETVEQRIKFISQHSPEAGQLLSSSVFIIYRPSSELLHGTFYGVSYFLQGSRRSPTASRLEFERLWVGDHFMTILPAVAFAAAGAIQAVSIARGIPKHCERQSRLLKLLRGYVERMGALDFEGDHTVRPSTE